MTAFDDLDLRALHARRSLKWSVYPPDVLPAWVAETDFPTAPPVLAAARACVERGNFGYPNDEAPALGEAFSAFAAAHWNWSVDPARVITLPDVMRGIDLALELFTTPGDGVVVDSPVYFPFLEAVATAGRTLVENPVVLRDGRYSLDLEGLERAFAAGARGYLLCSPHNPVGRVWSRDDLTRIVELAHRYGVTVVADEVHAPLTYPGAQHTAIATLPGANDVVITLTSATKAWNLPGLKCALMVPGSAAHHAAVMALPMRARMGASMVGYDALVAAYAAGGAWLDEQVAYLDGNRRLLADLLTENLPKIGYVVPDATYLAWLDCRALGLDDPAARFLERGRVALSDGRPFGGKSDGFVRLNFGTSRAILTEIVDRMASAL